MPALSKQTIVTQLVESLVQLKDFPIQSIDEFNDFIAKSTFKFNKPKNPSSSTRKTSPYHCFLKHNKVLILFKILENNGLLLNLMNLLLIIFIILISHNKLI